MDKLYLYICLLTLFVSLGECIQCHQCTTLESDSCLDPYGEDNVDDCEDRDTHCVKYKTVVDLLDSGYMDGAPRRSIVVTRSCERATGKADGCVGTVANGGVYLKCICSQDSCNNSDLIKLNYLFLLSTAFITFQFIFHNY